jgi:TrmH family RNA methyltransferase
MLSRSQSKLIASLRLGKFRTEEGLFVVEGVKMVGELLASSFEIRTIFATEAWIAGKHLPPDRYLVDIEEISETELEKISVLNTPNQVLAVAVIKACKTPDFSGDEWVLALDQIRDPGNMGTIIRTADWFGINRIVASTGTVDLWNPKVVQASMGSIFRMPVHYVELADYLQKAGQFTLVYGAFMDGSPIGTVRLNNQGIMVIGNESHGITPQIEALVTKKITIPSAIPGDDGRAESLNASLATAILCYEINRQNSLSDP